MASYPEALIGPCEYDMVYALAHPAPEALPLSLAVGSLRLKHHDYLPLKSSAN